MPTVTELRVRRDDLTRTDIAAREVELADGEVLCRVDRFALTANNITYAAHGSDMRYWDFFPAADGWGIVPVWGFGTVIASRAEGLEPGTRAYGYWPMADHAVLTPVKVTPKGFVDGAAHRAGLASVYNGYQIVGGETAPIGDERVYALFRPLYLTSFLLADVFGDEEVQFVLSSASSKTALGLAQALHARGRTVVGLTSPGNIDFVARTGFYTSTVAYADISSIDRAPSIYLDFAGNRALRRAVHAHFDDAMRQSIGVGDTHVGVPDGAGPLAGVRPEGFFAPTHLATRMRDNAPGGFNERYAAGWANFVTATAPWLRFVEASGADAVTTRFAAFVAGRVDPTEGIILDI